MCSYCQKGQTEIHGCMIHPLSKEFSCHRLDVKRPVLLSQPEGKSWSDTSRLWRHQHRHVWWGLFKLVYGQVSSDCHGFCNRFSVNESVLFNKPNRTDCVGVKLRNQMSEQQLNPTCQTATASYTLLPSERQSVASACGLYVVWGEHKGVNTWCKWICKCWNIHESILT